jgi:hypothetical protein
MVHGSWYMVHGRSSGAGTYQDDEQVAEIAQEDWLPLGPDAAWPTASTTSPSEQRRAEGGRQRAAGRGQITEASRRTRRKWKRLGLGGATGGMRVSEGEATGERGARSEERGASHGPAPKALSVSQRLSAPPSVFLGLAQHVPACASVCQRVPACASMSQPGPAASAAVSVVSQFARRAPARESRQRV